MVIMQDLIKKIKDRDILLIAEKVFNNQRLDANDALFLYEKADLGLLGILASNVRKKLNGDYAYFNRNFHIEPTNICIYQCKFCSYKRKEGEKGSWEFTPEDILEKAKYYIDKPITEVHIVGGVHPQRDLHYYGKIIQKIKEILPGVHIKAFTAIELEYMINRANISLEEGFSILKEYGLNSIPGGGAEIFDKNIRKLICPEKPDGERWLMIHKTAHKAGIPSNATMLYGHLENYSHRVNHMLQLRNLQDETKGFNAFIPLKYRKENNLFSHLGEISAVEDLKNYAVARLFLDNFPHLKAYWPMIGRDITRAALAFGVDDIDGTIDDSTKIYSMAGVKENNIMSPDEMIDLIKSAGRVPAERDSLYKIITSPSPP
jgi:aminodeoxyfutalosine synthase